MAEHMLILGIENPQGEIEVRHRRLPLCLRQDQPGHAHPAGGLPQEGLQGLDRGRRHRLDAPWAPMARLYAINPENGFFGVAPGTNDEVQPQRSDLHPEGHHLHQRGPQPGRQHRVVGRPGQESARERCWIGPASPGTARPPRRRAPIPTAASPLPPRTAPASALSSTSGEGVPISAIIFGGRRAQTTPAGVPVPRLEQRRVRRLHHGF